MYTENEEVVGTKRGNQKVSIRAIAESSILVALAVVINLLLKLIPFLTMPQGGDISLVMLPLMIIGFRRGWIYGVVSGFIYGLISFLLDGLALHWGSIFFDYIFAFSAMGLTGLFKKKDLKNVIIAIVLVSFVRYLLHSFSGVLFFRQYAELPESWKVTGNMLYFTYSFIYYNLPYMSISMVLCIIGAIVLYKRNLLFIENN